MITLTIDNRTITVPKGTNVLEAAIRLGIVVPHFCYHQELKAVGACRQCAVYIESGESSGVKMSCLVPVEEGMVVDTLEPTAVELRKHVIEWLMMNHPHDCPVCDEGGECQLQDMTIAGGHGIRRYRGKKRTYNNQDLGPFIEQEMNRCIQCYRCVRTYRDFFGGSDFGTMGSRNRVFFGRFRPGRLTSPFSGNLADVCPTGVFTDKTYRFRSRLWDLQEAPSVCAQCAVGCAVIPGARYRELQRVRSGVNEDVNGHFICDRGRFGTGYVNHASRPRVPRADGTETGWSDAVERARTTIREIADTHGGDAIAWLGSPRASLEANFLLKAWAGQAGSAHVVFECHPQRDRAARTWVAGRGEKGTSLSAIRGSDFILMAGIDPLNEAPMLAAAIRQAVRSGGHAAVIDPRPVELPFPVSHLVVAPEMLKGLLGALGQEVPDTLERHEKIFIEGIVQRLKAARSPVLIGGADLLQADGIESLLAAAERLSDADRNCSVYVDLAGPDSAGAAMLAADGPCFESILDGILDGRIRGLVCLESDPFHDYPDPARAQAALSRLDALIVMDYLAGEAGRLADVFLPTTAPPESNGTFVNSEGRMQVFARVMEPGIPIEVTGAGDHPPRTFERTTPGAEPRQAVDVLAQLLERRVEPDRLRREIAAADRRFAGLENCRPGGNGTVCAAGGALPPAAGEGTEAPAVEGAYRLLPVAHLFGSGPLAAHCDLFVRVRCEPQVILSAVDAKTLQVADGETLTLNTALGNLQVTARINADAVPGLVLLPQIEGTSAGLFLPGAGPFACRLSKGGQP